MGGNWVVRALLAAAVIGVLGGTVDAKDLFVKAGESGDGSKAKPFGDLFEALDKCEAGDVIHVTEGRYTGKLGSGEWKIPYDNISVMGGYSADFAERDPWKHLTMLVWDRNGKNHPTDERIIAAGKGDIIDGLFLNGEEQNEYNDTGREPRSLDHSEAMIRFVLPGELRNCVFVNTMKEGVVCENGTVIENNLFLNCYDAAIRSNSSSSDPKTPTIIKNNTIAWVWDDRAAGKGGTQGTGVYMTGPATITDNIIAFCDNDAVYSTLATARSTISNNDFFMNRFANFKLFVDGQDVTVDDKTMDLMEETGLKASGGNVVKNPGLELDKEWMVGTTKRTEAERGKVDMDDLNQLRQALGQDLREVGGKAASGIAPLYPAAKAIGLMTPKEGAIKAGARILKLTPKFSGEVAEGPKKNYEKIDLAKWADDPDSVDGKPFEMVVGMSNVANIGGIPEKYKADDHEGVVLYDPSGEKRVTGFYKKGSTVNRVVTDGEGQYDGNGKPTKLYTVQGIAYKVNNLPKAGFYIESIAALDALAMKKPRAVGRDWFVAAGAQGGDGSKEKPFRDPYQALEKCEAGDTIHVTGGDYVGKLRAGHWTIGMPDVAMLGGYNKDFTARDPWKNPTLLYTPEDFKGTRGAYTIEGTDDHSNFILDGFVFDRKLNNKYNETGDLLVEESDKMQDLWLAKPGCVIKDCVFLNGSEGAIKITASDTVENNIFLNHYKYVVDVAAGFTPEIPLVFKNNTVAFAWEERFGSGHGITADLLILHTGVHAIVDNNIFEFADQHAIRIDADPKDIELTNNEFAHNLWAEVYRAKDDMVVDNKNFDQLSQLGWKKVAGNQLLIPGLPLDQKWFDVYLNRTAYVEGKVTMDDWNQLRDMLGEPMIATGGKSAKGMAPAYDRDKAMSLFPKNPKATAGARPVALDVKFSGVVKKTESHEYQDVTWDTASKAADWDKLDGKRVAIKVVIERDDNQYNLDDIKKEGYSVWMVTGPQGSDSPGLPMRVYVPKATKAERVFTNAKGYSSGPVDETDVIKGVVRAPRQLVVEEATKTDE